MICNSVEPKWPANVRQQSQHMNFYQNMSYLRPNVEVLYKKLVLKIKLKKTDLKDKDVKQGKN
jgi:hypothetical protein